MNLEDIMGIARKYAAARATLTNLMDRITRMRQRVLDEHRAELRAAVNKTNELQAKLAGAIEESPEKFRKPRTFNVDGVKIGMTTKKGTITFEDADAVVDLIKRKFSVVADMAICIKESPNKDVLANWTNEDLARIGCKRLPDDPCAVVIKPTDSEVDKLVSALLEDVEESAGKELIA